MRHARLEFITLSRVSLPADKGEPCAMLHRAKFKPCLAVLVAWFASSRLCFRSGLCVSGSPQVA